jgi:hypothetical protein
MNTIKRILVVLVLILFLFTTTASAANVVRAFTALTGGGTGALDKISRTAIANGDVGIVVLANTIYFYQYNSSATDAEVSPTYIRPNDFSTAGVWYLVDVRSRGLVTGTSEQPSIEFYDSNATDGDVNGKIYVDCTTTTSGAENCLMYFQTQVGGTLATRFTINTDGSVLFDTGYRVTEVNGSASITPLTASQMSGRTIYNTGQAAADVVLTAGTAAAGYEMLFTVGTTQAANDWKFRAASTDKIYAIAGDGTVTAGVDNGYFGFSTPAIGNAFACWTFKTDSYDWLCKCVSGTCVTTAP